MFSAVTTARAASPSSAFIINNVVPKSMAPVLLHDDVRVECARGLDRLQHGDDAARAALGLVERPDQVGNGGVGKHYHRVVGCVRYFQGAVGDDQTAHVGSKAAID